MTTEKKKIEITNLFYSIFYTVFPTVLSFIVFFLRSFSLDFNRVLGDGELCMTSFLILAPLVIYTHKNGIWIKNDFPFLMLCLCTLLSALSYSFFKTNEQNVYPVVLGVSIVFLMISIVFVILITFVMGKEETK